jgi:hypothetical protein
MTLAEFSTARNKGKAHGWKKLAGAELELSQQVFRRYQDTPIEALPRWFRLTVAALAFDLPPYRG